MQPERFSHDERSYAGFFMLAGSIMTLQWLWFATARF